MMNHESEPKGRKAHELSSRCASIPGDPFPWEPEDAPAIPPIRGATPSPADPADPTSYDLGGGD
jgi:hypothetical protein